MLISALRIKKQIGWLVDWLISGFGLFLIKTESTNPLIRQSTNLLIYTERRQVITFMLIKMLETRRVEVLQKPVIRCS